MSKQTITMTRKELDNLLADTVRAADWSRRTAQHHPDRRTTAHKEAKQAEWYAESARVRVALIVKRNEAKAVQS